MNRRALKSIIIYGFKRSFFPGTYLRKRQYVRQIIDWNLEYFRSKGVGGNGQSAHVQGPVIVGGAETVDYVLRRAEALGASYTPAQVHAVLDAQMSYLEVIGAVGPEAPPEEMTG